MTEFDILYEATRTAPTSNMWLLSLIITLNDDSSEHCVLLNETRR